jgi:hypothetical protein
MVSRDSWMNESTMMKAASRRLKWLLKNANDE